MKVPLSLIPLLLIGELYLQWRDWLPGVFEAPRVPAVGAQQTQVDVSSADDLLAPPRPKEDDASVTERPLFLPGRGPPRRILTRSQNRNRRN